VAGVAASAIVTLHMKQLTVRLLERGPEVSCRQLKSVIIKEVLPFFGQHYLFVILVSISNMLLRMRKLMLGMITMARGLLRMGPQLFT
jgi:hypothetical protein